MQKTYLYLMVCVIGAMSLASCSEDSISLLTRKRGSDWFSDTFLAMMDEVSKTHIIICQVLCLQNSPKNVQILHRNCKSR